MLLTIEPNKGISSFNLGEKIENYIDKYAYTFLGGGDDIVGWDEYDFFDGALEVYVDKKEGTIESLCCRTTCVLDNVELIGLRYDEFLKQFNLTRSKIQNEDIWLNDKEKQRVYEVEKFSLQLWVNCDGIIKTIFLS